MCVCSRLHARARARAQSVCACVRARTSLRVDERASLAGARAHVESRDGGCGKGLPVLRRLCCSLCCFLKIHCRRCHPITSIFRRRTGHKKIAQIFEASIFEHKHKFLFTDLAFFTGGGGNGPSISCPFFRPSPSPRHFLINSGSAFARLRR